MSFPPSVGCVACVASVALHIQFGAPPWYSMYSPSFTLLSFSCTITFIPGDASSVLLKSNCPSSAVYSGIVGFFWQGLIIFNVIVVCGISRHHRFIGKQVSVLVIPAMELSFHVLMDCSATLTRWICGSTNWYEISFYLLYLLSLFDESLFNQWTRGLYPIWVRCSTCLV